MTKYDDAWVSNAKKQNALHGRKRSVYPKKKSIHLAVLALS